MLNRQALASNGYAVIESKTSNFSDRVTKIELNEIVFQLFQCYLLAQEAKTELLKLDDLDK